MRQLHLVLVFMLLLFAGIPAAFAQKRTITGKTTDPTGKVIPFVNVTVKGTTVGTTSNADGVYSNDVPEGGKTLVFSFAGYKSVESNLAADRTSYDVTLAEDITQLETVMVTALGVTKKTKSLGYSVTEVAGENLTQAIRCRYVNQIKTSIQ